MTERIPQIGEVLGRYRILELAGRGAAGAVFRAWDESLGREVALKTLWPQYAIDPKLRGRFEREARAAAKLDSPHVVRIYDIGEAEGVLFIAMEYVRGGAIDSNRPMDWRRAAGIVRDVASGVEAAHQQGIIHRDIKPANVMIDAQGKARIADFGIASALTDDAHGLTATGTLLGTPAYIAPEVIEGEPASPASDIYSLGILLYQLITGRSPFEGASAAAVLRGHLEGTIAKVSGAAGAPECVDIVIGGCTARDSDSRYPSAEFVVRDLEACLSGQQPVGAKPRESASHLPLWVRFIPGVERTVIEVRGEMSEARRRAEEAQRSVVKAEIVARDLESSAAEAEKHAAGWRSVAERVLAEGKENEAREALGYAMDYDRHANAYRGELDRQRSAISDLRRDALEIKRASTEAKTWGEILLARRRVARLVVADAFRIRKRGVLALIGIAVTGIWLYSNSAEQTAVGEAPQLAESDEAALDAAMNAAQNPDPPDSEWDGSPLDGVLSADFRRYGSSSIDGRVNAYYLSATCATTGGPELPSAVNRFGRVTSLVFESGERVNFHSVSNHRLRLQNRGLTRIENGIFQANFAIPAPQRPTRGIREITGVIECFVGPAQVRDIFLPAGDSRSFKAGPFDLRLIKLFPDREESFDVNNATMAARVWIRQSTPLWTPAECITWYVRFADQTERPAYFHGESDDRYNLYYTGPPEKQPIIGIRAEWVVEPPVRRIGTVRGENISLGSD